MLKCKYLLVFILFIPLFTIAQIKPVDKDTVNYRLVGFSIPQNTAAYSYQLQVASGVINNSTDFEKHIIIDSIYKSNRMIAIVPEFRKTYTWRVCYLNKRKKKKGKTVLYHFVTGSTPITDTAQYRLKVLDTATHHKDLLFFLDYSKAMYDVNGNVLWYIPNIPGVDEATSVRDLKPTPFGTMTFLTPKSILEIDYDGNVIWRMDKPIPQEGQDSMDVFHHELTRLSNGHYMVLGNHMTTVDIHTDSATAVAARVPLARFYNGKAYRRLGLGSVEEYDENHKLLWKWESAKETVDDSLFFKRIPKTPDQINPHMNSFYFNEKDSNIYVSFKNAHHILKVSYPEGKVVARYYGLATTPALFGGQHAVSINSNGNLILFNNNHLAFNYKNEENISYLVELKENEGKLEKVWEFPCNIDTATQPSCGAGGNILELNDGCYISCVGTTGRNFITNKAKKVIWNALMLKKDEQWRPFEEYRISVIQTNNELNKFIFGD